MQKRGGFSLKEKIISLRYILQFKILIILKKGGCHNGRRNSQMV
jgi:hypothetical protein